MSASFCDCVNQWEQVLGLQVLKDAKHLSVPTRGGFHTKESIKTLCYMVVLTLQL